MTLLIYESTKRWPGLAQRNSIHDITFILRTTVSFPQSAFSMCIVMLRAKTGGWSWTLSPRIHLYWMMWSRETENWCYLCQYIEWCDNEKQRTGATFVNILNDVITRNRELVLPLSIYWMMWSRETEHWCYLCQYIEWCDNEKQRTGATFVNILNDVITRNRELVLPLSIYWMMW